MIVECLAVVVTFVFIATCIIVVLVGENKITSVRRVHMAVYGKLFTLNYRQWLGKGAVPAVVFHILMRHCSLIRWACEETNEKKTWKYHFSLCSSSTRQFEAVLQTDSGPHLWCRTKPWAVPSAPHRVPGNSMKDASRPADQQGAPCVTHHFVENRDHSWGM